MNVRRILIRAVLILIATPIVLIALAFGFFYSVFYFPNRTSAISGTIAWRSRSTQEVFTDEAANETRSPREVESAGYEMTPTTSPVAGTAMVQ
jgi:hypothetical protein